MAPTQELSERLAQLAVRTTSGEPRRLGELWAERPVVLAFVRHFG